MYGQFQNKNEKPLKAYDHNNPTLKTAKLKQVEGYDHNNTKDRTTTPKRMAVNAKHDTVNVNPYKRNSVFKKSAGSFAGFTGIAN